MRRDSGGSLTNGNCLTYQVDFIIEEIEVRFTLRIRVASSAKNQLLARLRDTFVRYTNKKAVTISDPRELTSVAPTIITQDAERIIDLIRMARNADVGHFGRHKQGGLPH
jgi:hypothetical protein